MYKRQPFYLIMNIAVGGNFPGHPNPQTQFPAELVIDYVRVYDKVGGYGEAKPRGLGVLPFEKKKVKTAGKKPKSGGDHDQ